MPPFHGTDTSNNQGAGVVSIGPDLVALGADGWWHKATEGRSYRDPYWPHCRQARIDVGLRYGGPYHWLTPGSTVADQFRNFEGYVGDLREGEAIQLDIEDPAGLSDSQVFECIDRWEERWPGRVLHYMGRYYMNGLVDRCLARYGDNFRWWLPWYTSTFPASKLPVAPVVWQWAGGATGVSVSPVGPVDSNQIMDRSRLEKASGYGDQPKEKDEMTEAEWTRLDGLISQRVFDVVLGLWREPEIHQIIHDSVPTGTSTADAVEAMKQVMRQTSLDITFTNP